MGDPNAQLQVPEQSATASGGYFTESMGALRELRASPAFTALCEERGIPRSGNTRDPWYWAAVAHVAQAQADNEVLRAGGKAPQVILRELTAATPYHILLASALEADGDEGWAGMPSQERRALKTRASYYDGLVRSLTEQLPDLPAGKLKEYLIGVAYLSLGTDPAIRKHIRGAVVGMQQERAFAQIVPYTGRQCWHTTAYEDYCMGDYAVSDRRMGLLRVDIKASWQKVRGGPPVDGTGFKLGASGIVTIAELVTKQELGDRFVVSHGVAATQGNVLETILDTASFQLAERWARRAATAQLRHWQ